MVTTTVSEVERLALQLPAPDQLVLLERLAHSLQATLRRSAPQELYGAWRGKFPQDFDIDIALAEIRSEWLKEEPT